MNAIEDWLKNDGPYNEGLQLYSAHPNHLPHLCRVLQRRESPKNRAKLSYELGKLLEKEVDTPQEKEDEETGSEPDTAVDAEEAANKYQQYVKLHDLPPKLQDRYILQKNTFYKIWMLHSQLEDTTSDEEREKMAFEIVQGWDVINGIWQEIDYWKNTGQLLQDEKFSDLDDLNPQQLFQRKRNTEATVSRYRKKVQQLKEELEKAGEGEEKKLRQRLQRAINTLGRNEALLSELNRRMK